MTNDQIADNFTLLSKLMDLHDENSFKSKTYSSAAFTLEKITLPVSEMQPNDFIKMRGIGDNIGEKIIEQLQTGKLAILDEFIEKTPKGVLEILFNIKGLGPKKVKTIWRELEIETIGELLYACEENRLMLYKGFGEKTQVSIIENINFYLQNQGIYLYSQAEAVLEIILPQLESLFPQTKVAITGAFLRQEETIDSIEFVIESNILKIKMLLAKWHLVKTINVEGSYLNVETQMNLNIKIYPAQALNFEELVYQYSCTPDVFMKSKVENVTLPKPLRDNINAIELLKNNKLPELIQVKDIKGIIHSHSNWSDGAETIETMALHAKEKGFEYLVISDHSKTAFYAKGLQDDRVKAQHDLINELNDKIKDFKIFKSIESDILNDGQLDYSDSVLETFDLIIASVHSNLRMTEEKAMMRLTNAIENKHTRILGHMTGRLLLSRKGYPVNHTKIIELCAKNKVVIELNAHPRRLDMDWRFIEEATNAGVLISINPDAHTLDGYNDIKYGVLAAQKGMLTQQQNLSSFSLDEFEKWLLKK